MKSIIEKLKNLKSKNVLIIGDVMLDEYYFGQVSRISPEAPVPIIKQEKVDWSLGGAANVAANCNKIGLNVDLIGFVGNDNAGQKFSSILKTTNINLDGLIKSKSRCTTCKKRMIADNHQLLRLDSEDTFDLNDQEQCKIFKRIEKLIQINSLVLISDYAKGVISKTVLTKIVEIAKKRNCKVLADPKGPDFAKYAGVNFLKPNLKEFNEIVRFFGFDEKNALTENGKLICQVLNLEGLFVTLGNKGIQFICSDKNIFVSTFKREVFDLTGAGDTVFAFLAFGILQGLETEEILKLANYAASIAVSHMKTYIVGLDDILQDNFYLQNKIFNTWFDLKTKLDFLKLKSKKIVFTNGCFDLLHSGHIELLKKAREQGDVLVVALNSDDSVRRLKGAARPINNFQERATLMSSIQYVDFVVPFEQDTPKEILEFLKPDVLVKGGDYKAEEIVGYDLTTSNGGRVVIVDLKKGRSTSKVVGEIVKRQQI